MPPKRGGLLWGTTKTKPAEYQRVWVVFCGKTGIRTLGTRKGTTVFETVPIDRSGIFPRVYGCKGS